MTTTKEQTATERKTQAEAALKQLIDEREQILSRQHTAQATVEQLNQGILQTERSGEADTLAELRSDRRACEESIRDLQRALLVIDREIELAQGEIHAARVACEAEAYNKIVAEQIELLKTVAAAVETIVTAVELKERLAHRQDRIQGDVRPYPELSPAGIREEITREIESRLEGNTPTPLHAFDWSSWLMTPHGDLVRP